MGALAALGGGGDGDDLGGRRGVGQAGEVLAAAARCTAPGPFVVLCRYRSFDLGSLCVMLHGISVMLEKSLCRRC